MRPDATQIPMAEFAALERELDRAVQLPLLTARVPTHLRELTSVPFPPPPGVEWR